MATRRSHPRVVARSVSPTLLLTDAAESRGAAGSGGQLCIWGGRGLLVVAFMVLAVPEAMLLPSGSWSLPSVPGLPLA